MKPTREELKEFLIAYPVTQDNIDQVAEQFFDQFYQMEPDHLLFAVIDGKPGERQIAAVFSEEEHAGKMAKQLPNSTLTPFTIDDYAQEVEQGMGLYDLSVDENGKVDYIRAAQIFIAPTLYFGGPHSIAGTFFGIDEDDAINTAKEWLEFLAENRREDWDDIPQDTVL